MARDYEQQHIRYERGVCIDEGYLAFTTTGLTVELYTPLSKVWRYDFQIIQTTVLQEKLYINETVTANGYIDSRALASVTVTRELDHILLSGVASTDYIATNNYVEAPIGVCPYAGTLVEAWYYNLTKNGGTPLINIGHVPTNGTGTADPDYFLANAKAEAAPASSVGKAITSFTLATVGLDDLITFSTTGGTTTDPAGGWCQVKILPDPTSGLKIHYKLEGLD